LHFENDVSRVVFLVRQVERMDVASIDVLQNLFPDRARDFVIHINETDIVVVKEVAGGSDMKQLQRIASSIEEALMSEINVKTIIGIGSISPQLKDIAKSFKDAQVAIEVGGVFD